MKLHIGKPFVSAESNAVFPLLTEQEVLIGYIRHSCLRQGEQVVADFNRYAEALDLLAACEPVLAQLPPSNLAGRTLLFLVEEFLSDKAPEATLPAKTRLRQEAIARLEVVEALIKKLEAEWDEADSKSQAAETSRLSSRLADLQAERHQLKGQL